MPVVVGAFEFLRLAADWGGRKAGTVAEALAERAALGGADDGAHAEVHLLQLDLALGSVALNMRARTR